MRFAIVPGLDMSREDPNGVTMLVQFGIGTVRWDTESTDKFTFYPKMGIQSLYDEDDWDELGSVVFTQLIDSGNWRYDECINMSLEDGLRYARQILPL